MKKFLALLGLAVLVINAPVSRADEQSIIVSHDTQVQMLLSSITPLDLINWKVGDMSHYDVKAAQFGKLGTMDKSVTKDEGTAIWIQTDMKLMIQNEKIEMLMSKADGKILKMLRNGKEQAIPDDKIEIISQDYADVTVPAGTFKTIHIVAKSAQISKLEVWANPRDTVMEGTVKQAMTTQGIDLTIELTSFKRMP